MPKFFKFLAIAQATLSEVYSEEEADAIAERLCEEVLGVKRYQWVLHPDMRVPASAEAVFFSSLDRLCEGEPLQYVLGFAEFCGFRFNVSPAVLIPRPETEELCLLAAKECGAWGVSSPDSPFIQNAGFSSRDFSGLRIMDLCTGSGCIAWSLALLLHGSEVFGVDISEEALSVAREQPLKGRIACYGAKVPQFMCADILSEWGSTEVPEKGVSSGSEVDFCSDGFDVIVSNPPYVRESERSALPDNVKNYEPSLALFVPDSDPLIFYRAIANFSVKRLRTGGFGIVEINEAFGEPTEAIFSSAGFSSVKLLRDFRAKFRFVVFKK